MLIFYPKISVGFADPSLTPANPGWPLRNFLFLLKAKFNVSKISVVCLREAPGKQDVSSSIVLHLELLDAPNLLVGLI